MPPFFTFLLARVIALYCMYICDYFTYLESRTTLQQQYSTASRSLQIIMKSTEVQTLGELRMRHTANWWAWQSACISPATIYVAHGELQHAGDTCPSLWLQDTHSEWTRSRSPVPHISNAYNIHMRTANWWVGPRNFIRNRGSFSRTQSFQQNRSFIFQARVVL